MVIFHSYVSLPEGMVTVMVTVMVTLLQVVLSLEIWIDVWLRLQKKSSLPELTHHADAIGIQWYPLVN